MPQLLPHAEPETGPEDLTVLGVFLSKMLATKGAGETIDLVLVLIARLLRNEARLTGKLKALLRGRSEGGTEQFGSTQLNLWKEALEEAVEAVEADAGESAEKSEGEERPKAKPKRLALPAGLPRRSVEVPVEPELRICTRCGANKVCIGHETSEVLELIPARFEVIVYEREKLACAVCPTEGVVTAAAVVKPLDGGIPGPGLLADLVIRKAVDHTPINRTLGIYRRLGVDLPQGTAYGWWDQVGDKLRPLAEAVWQMVLGSHLVQADATRPPHPGWRRLQREWPAHEGQRHGPWLRICRSRRWDPAIWP